MSKATLTMPLEEYEELRNVITELEQKVHEEYLRNEKYNKVLSKLGIDEVIFNEIINGAEVKCCEQYEAFTNCNYHKISIILDNREERY